MRKVLVSAVLLLVTTAALGDAAKTPAKANDILEMCGARLAKVFAKFGDPEDVYVSRGSKPELDKVSLSYSGYCFQVRDKTVKSILFFASWTGSVKGIKISDSREDVEKVLGTTHKSEKSSIGVVDYGYELKDLDATFWTDFDANGKVRLIEVQLN